MKLSSYFVFKNLCGQTDSDVSRIKGWPQRFFWEIWIKRKSFKSILKDYICKKIKKIKTAYFVDKSIFYF
jgi:hypothetical protein